MTKYINIFQDRKGRVVNPATFLAAAKASLTSNPFIILTFEVSMGMSAKIEARYVIKLM
jgi:hypothetical protein